MNTITIPVSKNKVFFGFIGSILFVAISIFMVTTIAGFQPNSGAFPITIAGIIGIIFFSLTSVYALKKLLDKKTGMIINIEGIIDNTNASSIGLIKWGDITEIRTEQVMSTKFLLVYTTDPTSILNKVSGLKRRLMLANMSMYGTPLSIASTTLKYDFNALESLLQDRLKTYRDNISN